MKSHRFASLAIVISAVSVGCASSGKQNPPPDNSTLTAQEIAEHAHEPIEVMLQRKFPGVRVLRNADGDITLQIRGSTSATGVPRRPLYVIDDMEREPGPGGLESLVNPRDIESIQVLKGPATAIYGVRGGDGVIVIRTKRAPQTRNYR
jgi:TonB-dependent starch-binding outer membrane protein SusC